MLIDESTILYGTISAFSSLGIQFLWLLFVYTLFSAASLNPIRPFFFSKPSDCPLSLRKALARLSFAAISWATLFSVYVADVPYPADIPFTTFMAFHLLSIVAFLEISNGVKDFAGSSNHLIASSRATFTTVRITSVLQIGLTLSAWLLFEAKIEVPRRFLYTPQYSLDGWKWALAVLTVSIPFGVSVAFLAYDASRMKAGIPADCARAEFATRLWRLYMSLAALPLINISVGSFAHPFISPTLLSLVFVALIQCPMLSLSSSNPNVDRDIVLS